MCVCAICTSCCLMFSLFPSFVPATAEHSGYQSVPVVVSWATHTQTGQLEPQSTTYMCMYTHIHTLYTYIHLHTCIHRYTWNHTSTLSETPQQALIEREVYSFDKTLQILCGKKDYQITQITNNVIWFIDRNNFIINAF